MKRNEGFTLVELLLTVAIGSLVTFAAISLLLLGARVQYDTTQETRDQQTVRVAMALLEDMAGSGEFNAIRTTYTGWQLLDCANPTAPTDDDTVVFEYVNRLQTIYRGEYQENSETNEPVLTGLNNAGIALEGNLVRLSFGTDRGASYATRVYCRTAVVADTQEDEVKEEIADKFEAINPSAGARFMFLETLAQEYAGGQNPGVIVTATPGTGSTGEYYSHWYIGDEDWGANGWNKDTPWCACFLSWAAVENEIVTKASPFVFANVDTGMSAFVTAQNDGIDGNGAWKTSGPEPGDYIFFDWTGEQKDPAHVGVVLDTQGEFIFTIEGNSSGRVAVRKYSANDRVIMGYGVLPGF